MKSHDIFRSKLAKISGLEQLDFDDGSVVLTPMSGEIHIECWISPGYVARKSLNLTRFSKNSLNFCADAKFRSIRTFCLSEIRNKKLVKDFSDFKILSNKIKKKESNKKQI